MLNRLAAALRHWRRPRYHHPQLAKARAQCDREAVRFIREFEQLRREIRRTTDVLRLQRLHAAIALVRERFFKPR
jgi:hypothetical protein